ncbi:DEKNAAC105332 [Brettanomyces naardenensis]|uniref:DEKNAAC105332 n=1 Tax=Brettanomyces naardenensis TaxID=13370 RepID=A0A448YT82_BRENA|nr:DEKNAAC105332 [Brettanomyces naardenensis]
MSQPTNNAREGPLANPAIRPSKSHSSQPSLSSVRSRPYSLGNHSASALVGSEYTMVPLRRDGSYGETGQSVVAQPAVAQQVVSQPALGQQVAGQPVYGQSVYGQPVYSQSVVGQPVIGQPYLSANGQYSYAPSFHPAYAPSAYAPSAFGGSLYTPSIQASSISSAPLQPVFPLSDPTFANTNLLPPDNYHSPYYMPVHNTDESRPVEQLIRRFSVWKMLIKQIIFYFKEISIFKKQTYMGNKAMLENLEILRKQNSGKLKFRGSASAAAAKNLKKSMSSPDLTRMDPQQQQHLDIQGNPFAENNALGKFIQKAFLPPGDHSVMSLSTTLYNNHAALAERELITYNQLTLKLIPRLENLKESLNDTLKQIYSVKGSSDFKTRDLKTEIVKTGAILSDYVSSVELLTRGESKTSLGTVLKSEDHTDASKDPYLLRLKLDLQLKDQLFTEAHLKETYSDLQKKAVQLESILYGETQSCMGVFSNLVNAELDCVKDNLVADLSEGFLRNDTCVDWDYFVANDNGHNLLNETAAVSLEHAKQIRKKSDVVYPYQKDRISSCILSGYLERKSKYLKNYSKFYYVLTFNFLHEFKTKDRKRETSPAMSYSLDDMKVSPSADDARKFIIRMHLKDGSKSKYTFRCHSPEVAGRWLDCLADLCSFDNPMDRNNSLNEAIEQQEVQEAQAAQSGQQGLRQVSSEHSSLQGEADLYLSSVPSGAVGASGTSETFHSPSSSTSSNSHAKTDPNTSLSSLHLPTFRPVKASSEGNTPSEAAAPSEAAPPPPATTIAKVQHSHHSSSSLDSLKERVKSPLLSPSQMVMKIPPQQLSQAGRARIMSDESPGNEANDYFSFVAPRPRIPYRRSQAGIRSRSRSPSPAPALGGINEKLAQISIVEHGDPEDPQPRPHSQPQLSGLDRQRKIFQSQVKGGNDNTSGLLNLPTPNSNRASSFDESTMSPPIRTPGILPQNSVGDIFPR